MPGGDEQLILAVDTCSGPGSIALARGGPDRCELIGQVELVSEWTSTALHVEISKLLSRHQLTTAAIDAYAATNGPGSFTAVRIGAAAVKGLAEVHGKRVAVVSTLALIAQAAQWSGGAENEGASDTVWLPILDARRAQVFSGLYRKQGDSLKLIEPETVASLRVVLEKVSGLGRSHLRFCSPHIELFAGAITGAGYSSDVIVKTPAALAGTLARMGLLAFERREAVDPVSVDANYIRASDAELFWKA